MIRFIQWLKENEEPPVVNLPINKLSHEVYNDHPRHLTNLLASVKKKGIKEPLELWNYKGHLSVQDGKHRLQVARMLGHTHVPVRIYESEDDQEQVVRSNPKSSIKRKATDLEPEDDEDDNKAVSADGVIKDD